MGRKRNKQESRRVVKYYHGRQTPPIGLPGAAMTQTRSKRTIRFTLSRNASPDDLAEVKQRLRPLVHNCEDVDVLPLGLTQMYEVLPGFEDHDAWLRKYGRLEYVG